MIKYPKNFINHKGVEDKITQNVDIFPTLVDFLKLHDNKILKQFQGNSIISNTIKNREDSYAISELVKPFGPAILKYKNRLQKYDRRLICIRSKSYKYIKASDNQDEFYNLKNDPSEAHNLINSESKVKNALKEELDYWIKST